MEFKEITLTDKPIFDKYSQSQYYEWCNSLFLNLYVWRKCYNIRWAEEENVQYLIGAYGEDVFATEPRCEPKQLEGTIHILKAYFDSIDRPMKFMEISREYARLLENSKLKFEIEPDRDAFDYVYEYDALTKLQGHKLSAERNHIRKFHRDYPEVEYVPLTAELVPACKDMLHSWCEAYLVKHPGDEDVEIEHESVLEVLDHYEYLGIQGAVYRQYDKVIGLIYGMKLNTDTVDVMVEKGLPGFGGLCAAMKQQYLVSEWAGMTYVNTHSDMGLAGLRQNKKAYQPWKLIEKYSAVCMDGEDYVGDF